jgi:hypothetical protein
MVWTVKWSAAILAIACMLIQPSFALAAQPMSPSTRTVDIELTRQGSFFGTVFDQNGVHQTGKMVQLRAHQGHVVSSTISNPNGQFVLSGLRGGTYVIDAGDSTTPCRLWVNGTAPPTAQPSLNVMQQQQQTVRGQLGHAAAIRTLGAIAFWGGTIWAITAIIDGGDAS